MLEMGKYWDRATRAAGSGWCSDVSRSRRNIRAARMAAGDLWFCHRSIVNLKTKRGLAHRHPPARHGADRHDPNHAPAIARRAILASACSLAADPRLD
jgi:hypothetical protein